MLRIFVRTALSLRYRIRVSGIEDVARRGREGILFLPNHPALIDPVIVTTVLHRHFAPHPLADKDQIDRPGIRWFARQVGVRPVLDMARYGSGARDQVQAVVRSCAEGLRAGENILLYPSGHLYRSRFEDLRGNSAVESILKLAPEARVVLVRTRGLWGSSFSFAGGEVPDFGRTLRRHIFTLLKNFIFFTPRRDVSVELFEPEDLPRDAGRRAINEYLERFYNEDAPPNRYVPYSLWE
ncbi:MAG: 2-acyl-glycerophospho-ethanolamine acyltransferase, partial [Planctomycetota bacterium]